MFFSPELLSRRDSGFGLLWLAATLGAKSSFKKLPKRDVLGADISQLCTLITQPQEPLALRLSSNLMVGVARVYKVKQEIFLGDVTACFAALKKAVQDIRALSATGASLQMGQPTVRPDAVTLAADPAMALNLNFDNLLADWDQFLNEDEAESDDEYGVREKAGKKKGKRPFASVEDARAALHTLDENLEQMLSGSFDASFLGGALGGADASSSQVDGGINFGFDDNLFAAGDEIDLSAFIGGDLGEDWGATPAQPGNDDAMIIDDPIQFEAGPAGMDLDVGDVGGFTFAGFDQPSATSSVTKNTLDSAGKKRPFEEFNRENTLSPVRPVQDALQALAESPAPWNAEDAEAPGEAKGDIDVDQGQGGRRKPRRVRLLLDARTELTDEELKEARAQYVEGQDALRREMEAKKLEKESGRLIEEMLWGVPKGLRAPILVDFWLENFKVQVEARSGALHLEMKGTICYP
ncbi:hypothetical protein EWM64_g2064 [Hericium alpestre]|uniref:Rad21/Rec8-like protein N-terminal domain-containing protein n=1 Tax=Hericium alpestre TaxID=135208 RepID=A0A4Z0A6L8_9AGAM|nr:hypothetical protein EWM64_g2064 [Hericium alpestre]